MWKATCNCKMNSDYNLPDKDWEVEFQCEILFHHLSEQPSSNDIWLPVEGVVYSDISYSNGLNQSIFVTHYHNMRLNS